jgi:hypothetical protein
VSEDDKPRRMTFAGTTGAWPPIPDKSPERRHWPITVGVDFGKEDSALVEIEKLHRLSNGSTAADYLRDARRYIEQHDFTKKWPGGYGQPACLLGAVGYVMRDIPHDERKEALYARIVGFIRAVLPLSASDEKQYANSSASRVVTAWNDRDATTKEAVIAVLENAERAAIATEQCTP